MQEPEPTSDPGYEPFEEPVVAPRRGVPALWGIGEQATWVAGVVLALSAFTGWYAGTGEGVSVSVLGWHTGLLGKLVFFVGIAVLLLVLLRHTGIELPASVPESLVVIVLGSLATIFTLVRLISIPHEFFFAGRGIGLFISLAAALALIVAGLLEATEEL